MALNFNHFAEEANGFIKEYTIKLGLGDDTEKGGRILSSILHGLREVIPWQESLQLIAQFPMFLKGVYVNGWSSGKKEKVKNLTEFIDLIRVFNGKTSINDFESDEVAERYIINTFIELRKYVSLGQLEDIRDGLPNELKPLIYHNIMF